MSDTPNLIIGFAGQPGPRGPQGAAGPEGGSSVLVTDGQLLTLTAGELAALDTTPFGRALLALVDAAAGRTALGLGTAATQSSAAFDTAGAAAAVAAASQPVDSDLTAIAALTTTTFGRAFLTLADAAAGRTALGLGTAALSASTAFDAAGAATAAQAAAIAASQPVDADLTAIAALTTTTYGRSLLTTASLTALGTALAADSSLTASFAPLPSGTPVAGQVPVVTVVSPLALGWGAGSGGAGSSVAVADDGTATMSASTWGVTAGGVPYYDAAGVTSTDRAFLQFDPTTDNPVLIRIGA